MKLRSLLKGSTSKLATITLLALVVLVLASSAHGLKSKAAGQKKSRANVEGEGEKIVEDFKNHRVSAGGSNSTLISFLHLDKWISPRYIDQLTSSFNLIGVPGSVIAGVVAIVLLPIYLGVVFLGWLPLQNILRPSREEPDYSSYYKAPAPSPSTYYGEPSKPPPMYGYPAAPSPSPQYGYAEAPAPKAHYGTGYSESSAPSISYGYHPAPTPAPAPSPMYGGYPSGPAPSPSYGYSPSIPADPTPSTSYGYSAIIPSPAPSSQYGEPSKPFPSYGVIDDDSKIVKSDVSVTARKARSIRRLNDEQCAERLACELSKAAKGIQFPTWMTSMASMLPLKGNNLVNEARKLLAVSNRCNSFRCDSYDLWGKYY